ncbi:MAG: TIGR03985 family CRISPR-associated protein [Synechococcales bacterium]|nr:TIGR03985 family CRISPR-associated protein [Synechococcales bacterium]
MVPIFEIPPTIDFLSYLTAGNLSQPNHLAKALRLWFILQTLYDPDDRLPAIFTSAQWRTIYYPQLSPPETAATLLQNAEINLQVWTQAYQTCYPKEAATLHQRLAERPFDIGDRTLRNDFATLAALGWLHPQGEGRQRQYQRLTRLPNLDRLSPALDPITTSQLIPNELTLIADQFFAPINGEQRFILDIENVISSDLTPSINQYIQKLKQNWQLDVVQPIRLRYRSARRYQDECDIITYPVCIYYCQRAPYLFAFGQTPANLDDKDPNSTDWYDYRLDHILSLSLLPWQAVPPSWLPQGTDPSTPPPRFMHKTPQHVLNEVSQALGFEIHRPIAPLLLRFDRYFFANYIAGTEREKLMTQLTLKQAESLFNAAQLPAHITFQALFQQRPSDRHDIFCQLDHRLGDNNVLMRLRAWGYNVEVLSPWSLRQQMRDDLTKAQSFYAQS